MAKKKNDSFPAVFGIFLHAVRMYFVHLDRFFKYMFIPVTGTLAGVLLTFAAAYYYNQNIDFLKKFQFFAHNPKNILFGYWVCLLPFLTLLLYSLYRYIAAFGALNAVFYTLSPKKNAKRIDFEAAESIITRNMFQYVLLMLAASILSVIPPLWPALSIMFQVFVLDDGADCFSSVSRSIKLAFADMVNVIYTIIMLAMAGFLTYKFLPDLFIWTLDKLSVTGFLVSKIKIYLADFPYNDINAVLSLFDMKITSTDAAKCITESALMFMVIGFTLPLRCCCFTELYRLFDNKKIKEFSKEDEEIMKRAGIKKKKNA